MKIKTIMLLASVTLLALTPLKMFAQEVESKKIILTESNFNDTLVIHLKGSDKILFIGDDFKSMMKYKNADSLKQLFLTDYEKAIADKSITSDVQLIHYFVHASGKRRLKAESSEFSETKIDVSYEMKRLNLDLPKFQYCIHDVTSEYELQIYLNNPDDLKSTLTAINLNGAIHFAADKENDLNRNYKLEMNGENNAYKISSKVSGRNDAIELGPSLGIGVLGNVLAPVFGADLTLRLSDKYSKGNIKTGLGYTAFPFVNTNNGEITSVDFIHSFDIKFLKNLNLDSRDKSYWLGMQVGFMKNNSLTSYNNAIKVGFLYEGSGPFNYSFDLIKDKNNFFYGLTMKIPF